MASSRFRIDLSSKKIIFFSLLLAMSIIVSFLITNYGVLIGYILIVTLFAVPLLLKSLTDIRFGFFLLLTYSFILFFIDRVIPVHIQVGIGIEALLVVLLLNVLLNKLHIEWNWFDNSVTIFLLIFSFYGFLQFFNPNATSFGAWVFSLRGIVFNLLLYFLAVVVLSRFETIRKFTNLWLFLSLLGALYGIYQEVFGYTDIEWNYINKIPGLLDLVKVGPIMRKFSFFSDVTTFGLFMSFGGIFCIVMSLRVPQKTHRIYFGALAAILLLGMSYSGTRTATIMLPAGLLLYGLMSINRMRTLIFGITTLIVFSIFLFGPFYGSTAQRLKSAFSPEEDASMNVREINRKKIQPYIHTHPFGGGVYTTGTAGIAKSPGHILAGFPPDSGYLKTALEVGWIGLIIELLLYFIVLREGIINFYKCKSPYIKSYYGAYTAAFFGLCLANYAQSAMYQKPTLILVFSIFAVLPNMINFDDK